MYKSLKVCFIEYSKIAFSVIPYNRISFINAGNDLNFKVTFERNKKKLLPFLGSIILIWFIINEKHVYSQSYIFFLSLITLSLFQK